MIILNTERGFIEIESWDDIKSEVAFLENLDPSKHELKSVVGFYAFKEKGKCGLTTCHQPHMKGFIVETKKGRLTNIGKDCGKTHFGVEFETLSKQLDKDYKESKNREKLDSFNSQVQSLEKNISELRHQAKGADWVYKNSNELIKLGGDCNEIIVRKITEMSKARSSTLTLSTEATEEEIQIIETSQSRQIQRPHIITKNIAEIAGLSVFYPENNLRETLVLDLEKQLSLFKSKSVDLMTYVELQAWVKYVDSIENKLEVAKRTIKAGMNLLNLENLKPFSALLIKTEDKKKFLSFISTITNN